MFPDLFFLIYPAGLILWSVVGFCLTRTIHEATKSAERRDWSTPHPELIGDDGELIEENLYSVRFEISGHSDDFPTHQSFKEIPFALYRTRLIQKSRR